MNIDSLLQSLISISKKIVYIAYHTSGTINFCLFLLQIIFSMINTKSIKRKNIEHIADAYTCSCSDIFTLNLLD